MYIKLRALTVLLYHIVLPPAHFGIFFYLGQDWFWWIMTSYHVIQCRITRTRYALSCDMPLYFLTLLLGNVLLLCRF